MLPTLAALLLLAQAKDRPVQGAGAEPGKPAPAFKLKTVDGKSEVGVDSLRGKPALLIFGSYT